MLECFFSQTSSESIKGAAAVAGVIVALGALVVNAIATLQGVAARKLQNYQEIVKSHRDLWKLTLDEPSTYARILDLDPDLAKTPVSSPERQFVALLLLHMTSAFYFSKSSSMVKLEHLRKDFDDVLSLPLPRAVWKQSRQYFNRDFVAALEAKSGILEQLASNFGLKAPRKPMGATRWRVLLLGAFSESMKADIARLGDDVVLVQGFNKTLLLRTLRRKRVDFVVSCGLCGKIPPAVLRRVPVVNIHIGQFPPIRAGSALRASQDAEMPKEVVIHFARAKESSADFIDREPFASRGSPKTSTDLAGEWARPELARLFARAWPVIRAGRWPEGHSGVGR